MANPTDDGRRSLLDEALSTRKRLLSEPDDIEAGQNPWTRFKVRVLPVLKHKNTSQYMSEDGTRTALVAVQGKSTRTDNEPDRRTKEVLPSPLRTQYEKPIKRRRMTGAAAAVRGRSPAPPDAEPNVWGWDTINLGSAGRVTSSQMEPLAFKTPWGKISRENLWEVDPLSPRLEHRPRFNEDESMQDGMEGNDEFENQEIERYLFGTEDAHKSLGASNHLLEGKGMTNDQRSEGLLPRHGVGMKLLQVPEASLSVQSLEHHGPRLGSGYEPNPGTADMARSGGDSEGAPASGGPLLASREPSATFPPDSFDYESEDAVNHSPGELSFAATDIPAPTAPQEKLIAASQLEHSGHKPDDAADHSSRKLSVAVTDPETSAEYSAHLIAASQLPNPESRSYNNQSIWASHQQDLLAEPLAAPALLDTFEINMTATALRHEEESIHRTPSLGELLAQNPLPLNSHLLASDQDYLQHEAVWNDTPWGQDTQLHLASRHPPTQSSAEAPRPLEPARNTIEESRHRIGIEPHAMPVVFPQSREANLEPPPLPEEAVSGLSTSPAGCEEGGPPQMPFSNAQTTWERRHEQRRLLREVDTAYIDKVRKKSGSRPRRRVQSDSETRLGPVKGLPRNWYDQSWLDNLQQPEEEDLAAQGVVLILQL
ncbi:hypothetical protein FRB93_008587 [Tulasnella sp. JGI-2019a]|nr:hypothetical protein FRB93_008587 [Tulasnella sp. JGI-2019a]